MSDYTEQFRNEINKAGITPPTVIEPDGKLHRFASNGKPGDGAGWYILHLDGVIPAGYFGDWRTNLKQHWMADIGRSLSQTEEAAHRANIISMNNERKADTEQRRLEAQTKAIEIWKKAQLATKDHPYLIKKNINANGAKVFDGKLVLPLFDENHQLHSLQFIYDNGKKRFLPAGRASGCYFSIGTIKSAVALCIAEGYATAATVHEATGHPVAVAFNAGNLLAVAKAMRAKFPSLTIIVCADDDHKTAGNPGLSKAREAASLVNASLAVPIFGSDRPDHATDWNDMSLLYGIESVRKEIENATINKTVSTLTDNDSLTTVQEIWAEPQPLIESILSDPYPIEALPEIIRSAVIEVHNFTKAPIALVAASAIAAVSLAGQTYIDIKRADKLYGPTGLFMITIAESGERKSTCDQFFMRSIAEYEKKSAAALKPLIREYQAAVKIWESKYDGIKSEIRKLAAKKKDSTQDLEKQLHELEHTKPQPPRSPKLVYTDLTPEALKRNLAIIWPSAGIISSEGGIVFGAHGMNKDSAMRNLATYNQGWDGKSIPTDRMGSESLGAQEVRLTMAIQVQEPTLKEFTSRLGALARGTGYFARVLFSWPASTQGTRFFTESPESWPCLDRYHERISEILNKKPPVDCNGTLTPNLVSLAPLAKLAWVKFHDSIEKELSKSGDLFDVRDVASKAADNVARMAALFHLVQHGLDMNVGLDSLEGASLVVRWHLNESRRVFGELSLPPEIACAAHLESWLINYCRKNQVDHVPKKEVQQYGPTNLRKAEAIKSAMNILQELGRARYITREGRNSIEVNPALLNPNVEP